MGKCIVDSSLCINATIGAPHQRLVDEIGIFDTPRDNLLNLLAIK